MLRAWQRSSPGCSLVLPLQRYQMTSLETDPEKRRPQCAHHQDTAQQVVATILAPVAAVACEGCLGGLPETSSETSGSTRG